MIKQAEGCTVTCFGRLCHTGQRLSNSCAVPYRRSKSVKVADWEATASGKELYAKIVRRCALKELGFPLLLQDLDSFNYDLFGHALKLCKSMVLLIGATARRSAHRGCTGAGRASM